MLRVMDLFTEQHPVLSAEDTLEARLQPSDRLPFTFAGCRRGLAVKSPGGYALARASSSSTGSSARRTLCSWRAAAPCAGSRRERPCGVTKWAMTAEHIVTIHYEPAANPLEIASTAGGRCRCSAAPVEGDPRLPARARLERLYRKPRGARLRARFATRCRPCAGGLRDQLRRVDVVKVGIGARCSAAEPWRKRVLVLTRPLTTRQTRNSWSQNCCMRPAKSARPSNRPNRSRARA